MVDAARDTKAEIPPLLTEYWRCREFQTLPRSGGVDDQDYVRYSRMVVFDYIYHAVQAYNDADAKLTDGQRKIIGWLIKDGVALDMVPHGKQKEIAARLNTEGQNVVSETGQAKKKVERK